MELSGVSRLKADRETVWAALNNPEVLKASIPGCESFEPTGENEFEAEVGAKIGPVKAKFKSFHLNPTAWWAKARVERLVLPKAVRSRA